MKFQNEATMDNNKSSSSRFLRHKDALARHHPWTTSTNVSATTAAAPTPSGHNNTNTTTTTSSSGKSKEGSAAATAVTTSRRLDILNSRWMGSASSSAAATAAAGATSTIGRSLSAPKERSPTAASRATATTTIRKPSTATTTPAADSCTRVSQKKEDEKKEDDSLAVSTCSAAASSSSAREQRLSRLHVVRRSLSAPKPRASPDTKEAAATEAATAASSKQQPQSLSSASRLSHHDWSRRQAILMIPSRSTTATTSTGNTTTAPKSSSVAEEKGTDNKKQVHDNGSSNINKSPNQQQQQQQHHPVPLKPFRFATSTVKTTASIDDDNKSKKEDDSSDDMVAQMIASARRFKAKAPAASLGSSEMPPTEKSTTTTTATKTSTPGGKSRSEAIAAAASSLGAQRFRAMAISKEEKTSAAEQSNKTTEKNASIAAAPHLPHPPTDSKSVASHASNNTLLSTSRLQSQMRNYQRTNDTTTPSVTSVSLPATAVTAHDARSVSSSPSTTILPSPIGMRVYRSPVGLVDPAVSPAENKPAVTTQTLSPAKPGLRVYRPIACSSDQSPSDQQQQSVTSEQPAPSSKKPQFLGLRAYRSINNSSSSGASVASAPSRVVADSATPSPPSVMSVTTHASLRLSEEFARREQELLEKKNEARMAESQRAKIEALRAKRDAAKRIVKGSSPEHRQKLTQQQSSPPVKSPGIATPVAAAEKLSKARKEDAVNSKKNFTMSTPPKARHSPQQQLDSVTTPPSATDHKDNNSPVSSASPKATPTTPSPTSSWQERKNKAKELVMRRCIAASRSTGTQDSVGSVDAGSHSGSNVGDASKSPSIGDKDSDDDAVTSPSWTEQRYKASRKHRATIMNNSNPVPSLSLSHTTPSFELTQPSASIVSNLTAESYSDALSIDTSREAMHPAEVDQTRKEKQSKQYRNKNMENRCEQEKNQQQPPIVLAAAVTSLPHEPNISARDRMEILRADSSGSQGSVKLDGICGLMDEQIGDTLKETVVVLSPPRQARGDSSFEYKGDSSFEYKDEDSSCDSTTSERLALETGSDDGSSIDGYTHDKKHTSFDFRPLAENAEDSTAVVEASWDSTKVLFNEYAKPEKNKVQNKSDGGINLFESDDSAAEEMKENCPAAAVTAAVLSLQINTDHDDLDPLGWPRSPPGLMNVETKTDPFGSQESSGSEPDDDNENLLSGHSRSEDLENESMLSDEETKPDHENATRKAERLESYQMRLEDESSRGFSEEEEKVPEEDDDSDGFGADAGIVDYGYISQDSEEHEILSEKTSPGFSALDQHDQTIFVPTFDPAMILAHESGGLNDEHTNLSADRPEAEARPANYEGQSNDNLPTQPDNQSALILNVDDARLTSNNSADSTGSGSSRGLPPSGKPSLPLPPPPPPPPPVSRKKRKKSRQKDCSQSVPNLPPPPEEKLKQWEESQAAKLVCIDKKQVCNDIDAIGDSRLQNPTNNIEIGASNDPGHSPIVAAPAKFEVAKFDSKSPTSANDDRSGALFIFSQSSDSEGGRPDTIETVDTVDSLLSTYRSKMVEDAKVSESDCPILDDDGFGKNTNGPNLRAALLDTGLSPFAIAVSSEPQIISNILDFLGDPVAVCRMKMVNRTCCCYVDQNEHKLVRDAVRLGGMSMNVRPYFWLWVTLEKGAPPVAKNGEDSEDDSFDPLTPCSSEIASLERKGRNGKWHHVIERDVARAFGNLPPHKTGARLRTDSIVRALVTWGRNREVKRYVKGTRDCHLGSCGSEDSGDASLTPTDTVSDWGGVTPVGSFSGSLGDTSGAEEKTRKMKRRSSNRSVEVTEELVLNGNALTEEMKVALQAKLSFILHALAAEHEDVGYCQGMDYVVAHLLRILQDTIRWKAAHGTLPPAVKSTFNRFDSVIGKDLDLNVLYAEIDRSLVVEDCVFRVMNCFFTSYSLQHFYWPELRCLKTCCRVFEKLIKIKLPVLADHFEHHELNVGLFALGWFQTLFLYLPSMPSATVCHMWDIWLVERSFKIFFRVGTAILFLSQPILLNHDLEGMMGYLNTFPDATLLSPDILIACANQIKVTNKMLMELEKEVKDIV